MGEKTLPIITINRQYAAYGRTVAARLSEKLGIPYYDKDFIRKAVEQSGYSYEEIEQDGEAMSGPGRLFNDLMNATVGSYPDIYSEIFLAQKNVIFELAKSPCIIVGRCADFVLQEAGIPSFDIYLYADIEKRRQRASELEEAKGKNLDKYIAKRDAARSNYYKHYTGRDMDNCHNFNICIDMGSVSIDTCVDILLQAIRGVQK